MSTVYHGAMNITADAIDTVLLNISTLPDDLEGSVPDPANYRFAADSFLDYVHEAGTVQPGAFEAMVKELASSPDPYDSLIGTFALAELKRLA